MTIAPPNYTQIPNVFFDTWMKELSFAEFKILMTIARKTMGWHKQRDCISISQFIELTGISERCIQSTLQSLEQKGLICRSITKAEHGGYNPNEYGINVAYLREGGANPAGGGGASVAPTKESNTKENIEVSKDTSSRSKQVAPRKQDSGITFSKEENQWKGIAPEDQAAWAIAYPGIMLDQELARMREWIIANPRKANKSNWRRFIATWLQKASDTALNRDLRSAAKETASTPESNERTNTKTFYDWKSKANGALDHCYIKNGYIINKENGREARVNMKPEAFEALMCDIAGVRRS